MSKIDIDKFVVSLYNEIHNIRPEYIGAVCKNILDMCINKQGIFYKDGDIVEIYPKLSNLEQNGKNSKPANLSKSSKDLQLAVDDEIKRRCEGIDVDEMFDKVPPRILKTYFDFYKKGVVDTINKLKGE